MKDKHQKIINYIKRNFVISVPDIQDKFRMSYFDARNEIKSLESEKIIKPLNGIDYTYILPIIEPQDTFVMKDEMDDYKDQEAFIMNYVQNRTAYCKDERFFQTIIPIVLPSGIPLTMKYYYDQEKKSHIFSDNGGVWDYLISIAPEERTKEQFAALKIHQLSREEMVDTNGKELLIDVSVPPNDACINEKICEFICSLMGFFQKLQTEE